MPRIIALSLLLMGTAQAAGSVVVSQVYGGGGNSGATLRHDFIELFNRSTAPVDLTGWSVQYASSSGSTWQATALSGVLQPGQYLLVQEAAGSGGSTPLPTPDAIGTINMSSSSGKVALVNTTSLLNCGSNCLPDARIVDFVGFGSANSAEGGAAPGLSNSNAALRRGNGCTDSDNNAADFAANTPIPRNRAVVVTACSDTGGGNGGGNGNTARIRDIQGKAHLSPVNGQSASNVPGVVTLVLSNGFFMQDPQPDNDVATSEGIFVYTSTAPTVQVGDAVMVSGKVAEFRAGGTSGTNNLTTTQLTGVTVNRVSSGNALPAAVVIGAGGRIPPAKVIYQGSVGDIESVGTFNPAINGIDFWESLEGMRVQLNNAVASSPSNKYGEVTLLGDGGAFASTRTPRGGVIISADDYNPERLIALNGTVKVPKANVGDRFAQAVGVINYTFGNFKLQLSELSPLINGGLKQEQTRKQTADELAIASFNVENLAPADPQSKFDRLATQMVNNLQAPDIVGLMEIQDNNGATNDSIVDATNTYNTLIDAIVRAGGPRYQFRSINPVDDQDGGQPGGNIRQGFLFNPARVSFVDRAGGTATAAVSVVKQGGVAALSFSPGRIAPTDPAFQASRKPLVGEFLFNGQKLFVMANHLNSKGGDQGLFGRNQPPVRSSEVQRNQQTAILADFTKQLLAVDPKANLVVLGDLNDFEFSPAVAKLKAAGLHDLVESLPAGERYTYVFEGNSQALDHIMVSHNLANKAEYDVVHTNSEFADQTSDHDPEVARIRFAPQLNDVTAHLTVGASGLSFNRATSQYQGTITLTAKQALASPLGVALQGLPAGVSLLNATGNVAGVPYVKLATPPAVGQMISIPVLFSNSSNIRIGFNTIVYSGQL
ncbi:lamin tail domain-containing protein [Chitinivorax sp. B]|uniref:lamin tail domain-containing protein n=1 Tax=Chitinivorax sp. B TaxID=2502235 RepID=UPI0020180827|nr:lamin tail domain-containing protein [Chitinivorax sp. B]